MNGHPAVGLVVTAASDANTLATDNAIHSALAKLARQLPPGVHTTVTGDITQYTRTALHNVEFDLALGVLMAGLVLLVFLHRCGEHHHRAAGDSGLAPQHIRRHVFPGLQPRPHLPAGPVAGHRYPGGRLHRGTGEHPPPPFPGQGPRHRRL
ncbi:protein of unknown function [Candidatus Hydrogenisulfobacillus filiaventi]|uniref:Uncharacterized protein n=1 Tax=Candidatus Hydrogenisulfobacillus filiaventi TaxID=2707344 RepID=A0A6F8ZFS3_9FIRM|nr:protein of unknown function [Candidatus Hydrogenisulfobacillus filiaventi]